MQRGGRLIYAPRVSRANPSDENTLPYPNSRSSHIHICTDMHQIAVHTCCQCHTCARAYRWHSCLRAWKLTGCKHVCVYVYVQRVPSGLANLQQQQRFLLSTTVDPSSSSSSTALLIFAASSVDACIIDVSVSLCFASSLLHSSFSFIRRGVLRGVDP